MKTKRIRQTPTPHACRYCEHVSREVEREVFGSSIYYSCRDGQACGVRLRSQRIAAEGKLALPMVDESPF